MSVPLLEVKELKKHFAMNAGLWRRSPKVVHAADDISFSLARGETVSLVGESGCGKTTVGRTLACLTKASGGEIRLDGERIDNLPAGQMRKLRRRIQFIFQDPLSSLNPRMKVRDILAEPLVNFGLARGRRALDDKVADLMEMVHLPRNASERYPHEFSGGQCQRIGIARALATDPDLIICDEAVSALDVSVKAQIINLLGSLQKQFGMCMLFISHDLAVVEHLTHRVAVMYLGRIVELADKRSLFSNPHHPYTRALLSAVPVPDPRRHHRRIILSGDVPSPINPPTGCRFHTRCPYAFDRCRVEQPILRPLGNPGQTAACHLDELPAVPSV